MSVSPVETMFQNYNSMFQKYILNTIYNYAFAGISLIRYIFEVGINTYLSIQ